MREYAWFQRKNGKPVASRGRKASGLSVKETAGLPTMFAQLTRALRVAVGGLMVAGACVALMPTTVGAQTFPEIQPGHWYEVPNSRLRDVAASPSPGGKIQNIMAAWSGGALDTKRKQLLIWGGGHSDYAGNEVYAFDLVSLKWKRLSEPSVADDSKEAAYPDGQPRARHTYNYIEYVPTVDRLMSFGGSAPWPTGGGGFTLKVSEFDFDEASWTTGVRADVPGSVTGMAASMARYDPVSGDVFFIPKGCCSVQRYSPKTNSWTPWGRSNTSIHATSAIDPVRRLMVLVGGGVRYTEGQLISWSLDSPDGSVSRRSVSVGDKTIESTNAPGFDYHAPTGKFVGWASGSALYVLDPDTWEWTRVDPPAGNTVAPGSPASAGTYGRFRYYADQDVFVLVNSTDSNVFLYRPGWKKTDKGPSISISASSVSVEPGASVTLNWSTTGASSCAAEGAWSGTRPVSGSARVGPLNQTSTFALRCIDANGLSSLRQVSVAVTTAGSQASVQLQADRTRVAVGEFVTLSWLTTEVTSCSASGDWTGSRSNQGSEPVGPINEPSTFTLNCNGSTGSATSTVSVVLADGPVIQLESTPHSAEPDQSVKLRWTAKNAAQCMASGDWHGPKPIDGIESTPSLETDTTYTLTCDGPGGKATRTIRVALQSKLAAGSGEGNGGGTKWGLGSSGATLAGLLALLALAPGRRAAIRA